MTTRRESVVIVGSGPGGLSAALWLHKFKVSFVLLDRRDKLGGTLSEINLPIIDYLGLRAANGHDLRERLEAEFVAKGLTAELGTDVHAVEPAAKRIVTHKETIQAQAIVIATGLSRRRLSVPGEAEYVGRGVSYSGTTDMASIAGRSVAIIGGSDGALENALYLAPYCPQVTVIHRSAEFRARPEFLAQARAQSNLRLLADTYVVRIQGDGQHVTSLLLRTGLEDVPFMVDWVVIKVGFEPNTTMLAPGALALNDDGTIAVDRYMHTSVPGVFAAGDVTNARSPSIAAAVGDGAVAAREVFDHLRNLSNS
ncbi:MAG: NAD(P)/FAD-dependent oxidoreductase [Myxococcales bacterium]|nr:MAG: NAD(P)/FAD-dependent oxidoreductase [Myxococcales bacterium]